MHAPMINARKGHSYNKQIRVVSPHEYQTIQAAIDSITDASATKRYTVLVEPGTYAGFNMASFVSVEGVGNRAAIIQATSSTPVNCNCTSGSLANLTLEYATDGALGSHQGIVERTGTAERVEFHNLDMHITSIGTATEMRWAFNIGTGTHQMQLNNVNIETCAGGYRMGGGQYRLHDCNTVLIPGQTVIDHIAMQIDGAARVDVMGGRWGTGYWVESQDHGDDDGETICFYIPSTNTNSNTRLWIEGVQAYARNANATAGTNVNVIRAENGWVRVAGNNLFQVEGSGGGNYNVTYSLFRTATQPATGQGGRIEYFTNRPNGGQSGNASGGEFVNVQTFTSAASLDKYEAGLICCNATAGAFTVTLQGTNNVPTGQKIKIMKVNSNGNNITVNLNGSNYQGVGTDITISTQYSTFEATFNGTEWV